MARTGQFGRVKDLEKALATEGYARGDPQIQSPSVRKQLRRLCIQSTPVVEDYRLTAQPSLS